MLKHKDIIEGAYYKIVGDKGGCSTKRCKDCKPFTKGIKIINKFYDGANSTTVFGAATFISSKNNQCTFEPEDLELMTWKEIMANKIITWRKIDKK